MRYLILLLPMLFWAAGARAAFPSTGTLRWEDVAAAVQESNPAVIAAREASRAAAARVRPARAWPDPMLSLSREKFPNGETMDRVGVEQDIPFPGKKTLEGTQRRHEAVAAQAAYRAKLLETLADARVLYFKLYRSDRIIQQMTQNVDVMKATLRVAQARLQAPASKGMGSSGADIFSMMTELGQMENKLFEEKQTRVLTAFELNTLLDRELAAPVGQTAAPELLDIPRPLPEILQLAAQNDPMYLSAMNEERHARAMLSRARLAWAPDFGVMYDRTTDDAGTNGSEAGVRFTLPLWLTRPHGEVKEARAHVKEAASAARSMRNDVMKMVAMKYTQTQTYLALARNYRDSILPSAESALKLTRRQYESGGADYLRLLEAIRTLFTVQTEYYDNLYHYGEHWARLEQLVGAPLSSPLSTSQEMRHE